MIKWGSLEIDEAGLIAAIVFLFIMFVGAAMIINEVTKAMGCG